MRSPVAHEANDLDVQARITGTVLSRIVDVANVLSGVPPWTYERRFFPHSINRLLFALLVSLIVQNL